MTTGAEAGEPEVPVVKTQPPHSKHPDLTPLRQVSHFLRGHLMSLRIFH